MPSLPVRRVALYKHGVGYFEREGSVEGDQTLELTVPQSAVSDVLKSLTVLDLGGGSVSAVNYDSTKPLSARLAEVAFTIPDHNSLAGLLAQLKGARIRLRPTAGADAIEGAVLGIDRRPGRRGERQLLLSVLLDGGGLRSFALHDLAELQLLDDHLRRDLDYYLHAHLASTKTESRTFTLFAKGAGTRTVRVGYVVAAPVWKATYRVLLNSDGPPMIQGWAVVDNTDDSDWENVELTLVAGLPISFRHDLYTPRMVNRPEVSVSENTVVMLPNVESGVDESQFDALMVGAPMAASPHTMRKSGPATPAPARRSLPSSTPTQVVERTVGDLFEYRINQPVTIRRDQSALVPIVLTPFHGRSVLLYQERARPENPLRCVEFKNSTGLTLEGGPVTVLEDGAYVGEAMLDTLKPYEERLVPYSVELSVKVIPHLHTFDERVQRVTIRKGVLKETHARVQQTTYALNNKGTKDLVLYLDHPRRDANWKLVDTPAPHETTANHWRFKLSLAGGQLAKFVVKQRQPVSQSHSLADTQSAQLALWLEQKYLDTVTEQTLAKVVDLRLQLAGLEDRMQRVEKERDGLGKEQARIRENIGALGDRSSEKELRERYVKSLASLEDRHESLEASLKKKVEERDRLREAIAQVLGDLEYEGVL